jgi:hypothetical protein
VKAHIHCRNDKDIIKFFIVIMQNAAWLYRNDEINPARKVKGVAGNTRVNAINSIDLTSISPQVPTL